jgi:hypothetical protein
MDGMLHFLEEPAGPGSAPHLLGILYAEDFDDPPGKPDGAVVPQPTATEPTVPALTQSDVDLACAVAVEAARAEWETSNDRSRMSVLASIGNALAEAREASERTALAAAEGTVTTMLAMLSGALPHFCRDHGAAEVHALMACLLPALRAEPRVTVRAHPDLVPSLQRDLAEVEPEMTGTIVVLPAPLERGDLRVTWQNGSFARNTTQILAAMQDALGQLGLQHRLEVSPERSAAYAE